MNRKQFIEAQGATCKNWQWSWSFINEKKKIIIFGAWDMHTDGQSTLILSEDWESNENGRKRPGYGQSRAHIRLVEEEGYELQTYPIICANPEKAKAGIEPAKIERFEPRLSKKILKRNRNEWRACDSEQVMHSFFSSL